MDVLIDYVNELNWVAVLVATVAAFVTGAIWYSKPLFMKPWMKGAGLSEKDINNGNPAKAMVAGAISTFVGAAALAVLFDVLALEGAMDGALLGAMVALGFIVTNKVMHNYFEQKSEQYTLITTTGDIVALAVMGGVLGLIS